MKFSRESRFVGACSLLLMCGLACSVSHTPKDVQENEFRTWRLEREQSLRNPKGYLALVGLHWVEDGGYTFGSAPDNNIVFPPGRAPAHAGILRVRAGTATVASEPGVILTSDGQPFSKMKMNSDVSDQGPTKVQLGDLTFWLIERSHRLGLRLSDPQSPILQRYAGTKCFSYAPHWRLEARFESFTTPQSITMPSVLGSQTVEKSTGRLLFTVNGRQHHLYPSGSTDQDFFIVFADLTNGHETYGGGRFLKVPIPTEGQATVIDFNRAYNPPCAYNPYTTCPLPPSENKLAIRIEAGELIAGIHN